MILLGQPSYGDIKPGTAVDWQRLIHPDGVTCSPCPIIGTNVVEARYRIAEVALNTPGVSLVLWIDADMRFPCDTLTRMLAHEVDIVGANCRRRQPPHGFTARKNGKEVGPSTGLEEVEVVGAGILLTTVRALRKTLQSQGDPLFLNPWVGNGYLSEDYYFCNKARAAGFAIYIDHDLSALCRHTTEKELTYAEV